MFKGPLEVIYSSSREMDIWEEKLILDKLKKPFDSEKPPKLQLFCVKGGIRIVAAVAPWMRWVLQNPRELNTAQSLGTVAPPVFHGNDYCLQQVQMC